ncbi:hypothetical protein GCM10018980_55490 [Streptomyces capoamus]|uniref:Uncharacterized protein n=1 Tax=Streptomyces capoamus TaxID=68183 RepID=A0A919KEG3_9ACTN|nr:hypothetical protein GCM10010501_70130 [Streptomyces libani subsp. rufus]GHG64306.1 hypothetical protein GCM10018980_55490 [Streptomyces capoamus]
MVTREEPWTVDPWVRILEINSGTSCIVASTASSRATLPTRWSYAEVGGALILRTYHAVCH